MTKRAKIEISHSYIPNGNDASRQRVTEVATKLNLVERATEAGRKDEPRTSDRQPDETQRLVIGESQSFVGATTRVAADKITQCANAMQRKIPRPLDTALAQANIRRNAAEAKDRYGGDVEAAFGRRQAAVRNLRGFEEANRLGPFSAVYKNDPFMFGTLLLGLTLGEGGMNTFLLAELQERGLVGGLMLALGTGSANVLLGLGTGFLGWRLAIHVKPQRRALGILLTGLFMGGALALHLALGDLREAIVRDANASIDFLLILKPWRWFAYSSIPPFVLFAIGVATFVVAALKGRGGTWGIVATYWGHESLDRRFRAADTDFQDAVENCKDAVQNAFDSERATLRDRLANEAAAVAEIRGLANEAYGITRTLGDSIQEEIGRIHTWLRAYRDSNRAVRTSKPPAYFESYPTFAEWREQRLELTEIDRLLAAAEQTLAENTAKLANLEEATLREQVAVIDAALAMVSERKQRAEDAMARDEGPTRLRTA